MAKRLLFAPERKDVEALLEGIPEPKLRNKCIVRLMAFGGLREAEVVGDVRRLKGSKRGEKVDWEAYERNVREWQKAHKAKFPYLEGKVVIPGLYVEDVDFVNKQLVVYGKGWALGRERPELVPIDTETLRLLKQYIEEEKIRGKLFDVSTRQVRRIVKQTAIKLGLPSPDLAPYFSPHRLRAFFITEIADRYGIEDARHFARHKQITTTQRYAFLRRPREKYEELFER